MLRLEYMDFSILISQNLTSKKTSYEKIIVILFCRFNVF